MVEKVVRKEFPNMRKIRRCQIPQRVTQQAGFRYHTVCEIMTMTFWNDILFFYLNVSVRAHFRLVYISRTSPSIMPHGNHNKRRIRLRKLFRIDWRKYMEDVKSFSTVSARAYFFHTNLHKHNDREMPTPPRGGVINFYLKCNPTSSS